MARLARDLGDKPLVLKGGTALLLNYGLTRHSVDLDYDSSKYLNLDKAIASSLTGQRLKFNLSVKKRTDTTTRYIVRYSRDNTLGQIKIEVKNNKRINDKDVVNVNGYNVYTVDKLCDMKLTAFRERTSARDIYDIAFLVDKHADKLTAKTISKLKIAIKDLEAVYDRYHADWTHDPVLNKESLSEKLMKLEQNIEAIAGN